MRLSSRELKGFLATCLMLTPLEKPAVSLAASSANTLRREQNCHGTSPEERAAHALNRSTLARIP